MYSNAQIRDRKTLLSSVVAIVLLILLFYSFGHAAGGYGYHRYAQRRQMRAKFPEDDEQPIIFSKMDYLNQTRKVILISSASHFSSCLIISAK